MGNSRLRGRPEWEQVFREAEIDRRFELPFTRTIVTLLIPIAVAFYSWQLALFLAIPCGIILWWRASRWIRGG